MVIVDVGALDGSAERFLAAAHDAGAQMKALLDEKAATERSGHEYTNRTGTLESSTYAGELALTDDGASCTLGAFTDYAAYVSQRGLMQIDELAGEAEVEIAYLLDAIPLAMGL